LFADCTTKGLQTARGLGPSIANPNSVSQVAPVHAPPDTLYVLDCNEGRFYKWCNPKKESRNAYMAQLKIFSSEFQNGVDVFKVMASKVTGFLL